MHSGKTGGVIGVAISVFQPLSGIYKDFRPLATDILQQNTL